MRTTEAGQAADLVPVKELPWGKSGNRFIRDRERYLREHGFGQWYGEKPERIDPLTQTEEAEHE